MRAAVPGAVSHSLARPSRGGSAAGDSSVTVIIRAYNADGYHKDILVLDEQQVRMHESRVKETFEGMSIDPSEFPEMVRFVVVVKR